MVRKAVTATEPAVDVNVEVAAPHRHEIRPQHLQKMQGGKEHLTYPGLLDMAHDKGLVSIQVTILQFPSPENKETCVCHAIATDENGNQWSDIGDANPDNVPNKLIGKHLIRMASTRAKGRTLRDFCNLGDAMAEEFGGDTTPTSNGKVNLVKRFIEEYKNEASRPKLKEYIMANYGPLSSVSEAELRAVPDPVLIAALGSV